MPHTAQRDAALLPTNEPMTTARDPPEGRPQPPHRPPSAARLPRAACLPLSPRPAMYASAPHPAGPWLPAQAGPCAAVRSAHGRMDGFFRSPFSGADPLCGSASRDPRYALRARTRRPTRPLPVATPCVYPPHPTPGTTECITTATNGRGSMTLTLGVAAAAATATCRFSTVRCRRPSAVRAACEKIEPTARWRSARPVNHPPALRLPPRRTSPAPAPPLDSRGPDRVVLAAVDAAIELHPVAEMAAGTGARQGRRGRYGARQPPYARADRWRGRPCVQQRAWCVRSALCQFISLIYYCCKCLAPPA